MDRFTSEMKLWLFDLAHGNLVGKNDLIVKGYIKHYALFGCVLRNVQDDIIFHSNYGDDAVGLAMSTLVQALTEYSQEK